MENSNNDNAISVAASVKSQTEAKKVIAYLLEDFGSRAARKRAKLVSEKTRKTTTKVYERAAFNLLKTFRTSRYSL